MYPINSKRFEFKSLLPTAVQQILHEKDKHQQTRISKYTDYAYPVVLIKNTNTGKPYNVQSVPIELIIKRCTRQIGAIKP